MKASELITLLQMVVSDVGDRDLVVIRQTGPDSFVAEPVTTLRSGFYDNNQPYVVIE